MPEFKGKSSAGVSVFSQISSAWSSLAPERKKVFEAESQALKAQKESTKVIVEKKPPTAYGLYVQQRYVAVASKNPSLKATEIISFVAREWKSMPEGEKKQRQAASECRQ